MSDKQWWRVYELSHHTRIPASTLYRWVRDGTLESRYIDELPSGTVVIDIAGLYRKRSAKSVRRQQRAKANATANRASEGSDV